MKDFGKKLIAWYEKNKRDLPWRHTRDPYRIWLSEIILQQTRVDQGLSYYLKFVELFPTVFDLANAHEDVVLKAWQGLGYYSRARNLHGTAKVIAEKNSGVFPKNASELQKLKGIGPYTAAAISSFCHNEQKPVIDGNVIRVLSRLFAIDTPADTAVGKQKLAELSEFLLDTEDAATYNQAIMEFGATYCVPNNPGCNSCIFNKECIANSLNRVSEFPMKVKKTEVKDIWIYYFDLEYKSTVYIRQRKSSGIWKGLFDFPSIESATMLDLKSVIQNFMSTVKIENGAVVSSVSEEFVHLLSHRKIHARFISIKCQKPLKWSQDEIFQVTRIEFKKYGIPRLVEKYLHSKSEWKDLWA